MKSDVEYGFSSKTHDGNHILLWDFDVDKNFISYVYDTLQSVQKSNNLGDIYIISSRQGFNAICLDKYPIDIAFMIHCETQLSDTQHDVVGKKRHSWVLRIGSDKKVIYCIKGNSNHNKSNAHRLLMSKVFKVFIKKDKSFDNSHNVLVDAYIRKKNGGN